MFLTSILWLLSWPLLIILSYFIVRSMVKQAERRFPPGGDS